ncbi:hypothetical protein B0H63DRAFT_518015 [Podospora didyma]|uniref:MalT-like TPR region domain-containing protein n=1 Tax=Podospora didyma TaxID=330526 RepID=A0AAE0P816_9PEZI|nr:hypothetical protein B0H63DRAFT_518015 [Podospora didyma]
MEFNAGNKERGKSLLDEALPQATRIFGPDNQLTQRTMATHAYMLSKNGMMELTQATEIILAMRNKTNDVFTEINNIRRLGNLHAIAGQHIGARGYFQEAISSHEMFYGDTKYVAQIELQIAECYVREGERAKAEEFYKSALKRSSETTITGTLEAKGGYDGEFAEAKRELEKLAASRAE